MYFVICFVIIEEKFKTKLYTNYFYNFIIFKRNENRLIYLLESQRFSFVPRFISFCNLS